MLTRLIYLGALVLVLPAAAQVPGIINYQGRLQSSGTNYSGTCQFKFALVDASGGTTYWCHGGSSSGGGEPSGAAVALTVNNGLFAVNLGDLTVSNMAWTIPASVFTNSAVYLRIWVYDPAKGSQLLSPDQRIGAVGYAMVATSVMGAVGDAQLSTNVARLNASQTFAGVNTFAGAARLTNAANVLTGLHAGDGSGLTNLNAANLTGNVADGQLSANVARLNANQTFAGVNTFAGAARLTNAANVLAGLHAGDGSGLTNVNAANLTGNVGDAQLSANVARLNANQTFAGVNTFAGAARLTNAANVLSGLHAGDGSGLTNLNATNLTGNLPSAAVETALPSGAMIVSATPQDPVLVAKGYLAVMSVPALPWVDGGDAADAPAARTGHTAIWDGQEMIVWGGSLGGGTFWSNSGGSYRPDLDAWSLVSMLDAPGPRAGHSAVWSGTAMLIWGGNGADGPLNTGGAYRPATTLWTAISTNGAPSARAGHIAVWTGSRMAIWGGQNGNGLLGDGGLYDPVADQWTALALANPPVARTGATAVWAGDRILVWGGAGTNGMLNSGGQLLFTNGTPAQWRAMTLTGVPAGRRHHSAVWTGQKLIVWGGDDGAAALGDGAAYDPVADTWETLPSANAPAPRYNHATVWTGLEMLILDGSNSTGELASAAAYAPATHQWRTAGSGGNPQARTGAAAVWSGAEVLVFGGQAAGAPMAWLQRLNPQPAWYFYRKP